MAVTVYHANYSKYLRKKTNWPREGLSLIDPYSGEELFSYHTRSVLHYSMCAF